MIFYLLLIFFSLQCKDIKPVTKSSKKVIFFGICFSLIGVATGSIFFVKNSFYHSKKNLNMAQLKEEVKNMLPFIYECQLKNSRSCMKFDCEKILGDHKLKTVGGEESIVEINSHLKMGQFFSWFFMVNQDFLPTEGCVIFNQSVEKAVFCLFKDLIKECSDLFFVKIKVVDFKSGHSSNNIVQDNIFLTLIQEGKESEINSENDKILSLIKFFKPSLTIEGDFLPFLSKNNFFDLFQEETYKEYLAQFEKKHKIIELKELIKKKFPSTEYELMRDFDECIINTIKEVFLQWFSYSDQDLRTL